MTETAQAKARGGEAYKAGRFDDAIKEFTTAVRTNHDFTFPIKMSNLNQSPNTD
jgi:hypothetical protein